MLTSKVRRTLLSYGMLDGVSRVVAAVSGGADSAAMLLCLKELQEEFGFSLCCAHFNHRLRGAESDADEAFVKELCARLGVECRTGGGEIAPAGRGLEDAARQARYGFLHSVAGKDPHTRIATAHTQNDNAETVLFHLARGTGLRGAGGIAPVCGRVIRPMIDLTRRETEAICREAGVEFRTDSSNEDKRFSRNRIRLEVLPALEEAHPGAIENIARFARAARAATDDLTVRAEAFLEQNGPDPAAMLRLSEALRAAVWQVFLERAGLSPDAGTISRCEALLPRERASLQLGPDCYLEKRYGRLEFREKALRPQAAFFSGEEPVFFGGYRVQAEKGPFDRRFSLRAEALADGAWLCAPRPGDRFLVPGVGHRNVARICRDQKIPREKREGLPMLVKNGEILWIAQIGASADARAEKGQDYINISAEECST